MISVVGAVDIVRGTKKIKVQRRIKKEREREKEVIQVFRSSAAKV